MRRVSKLPLSRGGEAEPRGTTGRERCCLTAKGHSSQRAAPGGGGTCSNEFQGEMIRLKFTLRNRTSGQGLEPVTETVRCPAARRRWRTRSGYAAAAAAGAWAGEPHTHTRARRYAHSVLTPSAAPAPC